MKKLFLLPFTILFLNIGVSQNIEPDLSQTVKKVENSVFIIYTFNENNEQISQGSGFFISNTGIGITNFHVLEGCTTATIKTKSGNKFSIKTIIDFDEQTDLVKFKIENLSKKLIPSLVVAKSIPKRGESIFNIGNPLGLEQTVSSGILSSIREVPPYGDLIQITAPISEGSSGSPVFNTKGEVIGVATMGFKRGQNLNFAVTSKQIQNLNKIQNKLLKDLNKSSLSTENYEKAKEEYIVGNFQIALKYLKKELDVNIQNHLALNLKGRIQTDIDDYPGAIESLFYATKLDSLNKDYCNNYGVANAKYGYSLKGDFDSFSTAHIAYSRAIDLDPMYEVAYFNKAFLIYNNIYSPSITEPVIKESSIYDALELVNKLLEINPEYAKAYCLRANIKFKLKDNWSALSDVDKAIALDDKNFEFYFFRGELKSFGLSDYKNAIIDFNKAYDLTNQNKKKADIIGLRCITKKLFGMDEDACEDAKLAYQLDNIKSYQNLIDKTCN